MCLKEDLNGASLPFLGHYIKILLVFSNRLNLRTVGSESTVIDKLLIVQSFVYLEIQYN
jgi:hypothetical protein